MGGVQDIMPSESLSWYHLPTAITKAPAFATPSHQKCKHSLHSYAHRLYFCADAGRKGSGRVRILRFLFPFLSSTAPCC